MTSEARATKAITFGEVPIGGWFKEKEPGTWHLKTSGVCGTYQSWGTRYEPRFSKDETVFVEAIGGP